MKHLLPILFIFSLWACNTKQQDTQPLIPVPFNQVQLEDEFWLQRLKTQKETLVPFALGKTESAVENLRKAALVLQGDTTDLPFPHRFVSSDLYKVMEGAAYLLKLERDQELEEQLDNIINIIGSAQKDDGYLYVAHIANVAKNYHAYWGPSGMGDKPYSWVIHSHELYNMGHMYEGAIAYFQATGKRKWLDIAEKNAKHINKVFFEGDPNYNNGKPVMKAPGHEEIELALVKLYRVTNNQLYLDMARKFLDIRGVTLVPDGEGCMSPTYAQMQKPVTEQTEAVGHAVRAAYLYTGMADVDAASGTHDYSKALNNIWGNLVDKKMHITGGLGAMHGIEGFGPDYDLPNKETYNETCAAVGNVFFNYRMFLAEKDAKFLDVAEVALYNNSLAGVNMEGNKFFYVNPLEADGVKPFNQGKKGRSPWFGCACCPSNIARLIPQVSGMMYAYSGDDIFCTFYAENSTEIMLESGKVAIQQKTKYPFSGNIVFQINPEKENQSFALKLRIPQWATTQFMPGQLYSYANSEFKNWEIRVNGKSVKSKAEKGFATILRKWNKNDKVELVLPMDVRFNTADQRVEADRNRMAVTRGPLVYCIEEPDNKHIAQEYYFESVPQKNVITNSAFENGILKGVMQIEMPAQTVTNGKEQVRLIPYYAWNNRGEKSMNVWIPDNKELAKENLPFNPDGKLKSVKASHTFESDNVNAISDGKRPKNSHDTSIARWTSWPQKGKPQWIEFELKENKPIRSIGIYWYDDNGGVQVPKSWKMEYKKDGKFVPFKLYVTDSYNCFKDQYNIVHPAGKFSANHFRIKITPQNNAAVGVLDVDIEYEPTN